MAGVSVELPLYLKRVDTLRQARAAGPKLSALSHCWLTSAPASIYQASAKSSPAARAAGTCATLRSAPGAEWRIRLSRSRWQLKAGDLGPPESTGCGTGATFARRKAQPIS
jgi:hypothetical protein